MMEETIKELRKTDDTPRTRAAATDSITSTASSTSSTASTLSLVEVDCLSNLQVSPFTPHLQDWEMQVDEAKPESEDILMSDAPNGNRDRENGVILQPPGASPKLPVSDAPSQNENQLLSMEHASLEVLLQASLVALTGDANHATQPHTDHFDASGIQMLTDAATCLDNEIYGGFITGISQTISNVRGAFTMPGIDFMTSNNPLVQFGHISSRQPRAEGPIPLVPMRRARSSSDSTICSCETCDHCTSPDCIDPHCSRRGYIRRNAAIRCCSYEACDNCATAHCTNIDCSGEHSTPTVEDCPFPQCQPQNPIRGSTDDNNCSNVMSKENSLQNALQGGARQDQVQANGSLASDLGPRWNPPSNQKRAVKTPKRFDN